MHKNNILWTLLLFIFLISSPGEAKIYIDITGTSSEPFPIAIAQPFPSSSTVNKELEHRFTSTLTEDLRLLSLFRFIDKKAFLEDPTKKSFSHQNIDFANWAVLDTLGLVKASYQTIGKQIEVTAKLFDVLGKSQIIGKKYKISKTSDVDKVAHRFANEIVKNLTGKEGIFKSKLTFVRQSKKTKCKTKNGKKDCRPILVKNICTMNFNGDDVRQLTFDNSISLSPTFTHDSQKIFYTSFKKGNRPQLYTYDLSTQLDKKLVSTPGMLIGLNLDPLGRYIATTMTKDGNSEIYLLNMRGQIAKRVTNNRTLDVSGRISPDGKKIAFVSDRRGSTQIFISDLEGSNPKQVTFKGKNNTEPAWSPDGKKLVFAGMDTDGLFDIFLLHLDRGNQIERLTYDSKDNIEPTWSPGGHLIAFSSNRRGRYHIYTMRPDGSHQKQLSKKPWNHRSPSWSRNN